MLDITTEPSVRFALTIRGGLYTLTLTTLASFVTLKFYEKLELSTSCIMKPTLHHMSAMLAESFNAIITTQM